MIGTGGRLRTGPGSGALSRSMLPVQGALRVATVAGLCLVSASMAMAAKFEEALELARTLETGSEEARLEAAMQLGGLASSANVAIDALARTARSDPNHAVRMQAIRALERISGKANVTVPVLVALLSDPVGEIRWAGAGALENFGLKATVAVPALVNLLDDPDPIVRISAASTLGKIGPVAVAALMRALEDPNPVKRVHVLKALAGQGARAGVAVPRVAALAGADEVEVRSSAVYCLRRIAGDRNWPGESGWLTDPKEDIWPKAMTSAERIREYPELRSAIVEASLRVFIRLVDDPSPEVRYEAIKGYADLGTAGAEDARAIARHLVNDEPRIRRAAADALGSMGAAASEGAQDLVRALGDPDANVVWAVVQALRARGAASVPVLWDALGEGDPLIVPHVLTTVIELGPVARDMAPRLVAFLHAPDPRTRALAAEAIGSIGATEASDILQRVLLDDSPEVRDAASWALVELGTERARP